MRNRLRIREEKTSEIRAERGKIHYDHDQREKIHSPCQTDGDMHPRMQTIQTNPVFQNEKYITKFDQTDRNSEDWQKIFGTRERSGSRRRIISLRNC